MSYMLNIPDAQLLLPAMLPYTQCVCIILSTQRKWDKIPGIACFLLASLDNRQECFHCDLQLIHISNQRKANAQEIDFIVVIISVRRRRRCKRIQDSISKLIIFRFWITFSMNPPQVQIGVLPLRSIGYPYIKLKLSQCESD